MSNSPPPAPKRPTGPAPLRRSQSVRRTSSIDVTWPHGQAASMHFEALARDIYTDTEGAAPILLRQDAMNAVFAKDRSIESIVSQPPRAEISGLVGAQGGGGLRKVSDTLMPAERRAGSPLYLLLDDLSGASLIAPWAWSRWKTDWVASSGLVPMSREQMIQFRKQRMENICTGYASGSSSLEDVDFSMQSYCRVGPLANPSDPFGWHPLPCQTQASMRRARRIDVFLEAGLIQIDASFQDSASDPKEGRVAVHEYRIHASAALATMALTQVQAIPCILPYPECPNAARNMDRLPGLSLAELRTTVLEKLRRTDGCTHLNDALRALAEVPMLVADIQRQR